MKVTSVFGLMSTVTDLLALRPRCSPRLWPSHVSFERSQCHKHFAVLISTIWRINLKRNCISLVWIKNKQILDSYSIGCFMELQHNHFNEMVKGHHSQWGYVRKTLPMSSNQLKHLYSSHEIMALLICCAET